MKDLYKDSKSTVLPAKENKEVKAKNQFSRAYRILIKPMVTEKASIIASANKYIFQVSRDANKIEISKAINDVYGIKPVSVNIVTMGGKKTRYGRITGKRKNWKKAVITLPEGSSIKLYEGV
ncbi:50S ribosomal protein L23 [Candidatus Falkowbacteria bacterium CG_4_9_14_3_um_filter_36_9]|uniref:Large ribosomal subunit protein uL23 n=2 Tax=Candidatus Falkowiibacteriota TaxID=1752728 RepID=A0A2M7DQ51_9BACT|nr:MAG: 50S ribosomal protein L23 [Candidatus Falkowbacteria bacterium CG02_land_8_20_14_3_00_36_14]PIX12093.1 MAG: 50S ribosomal protein L23 [Candidatus Falkowbacteria bacterium CG_4_8_14_3_um_filter_36_11]PJA10866.1 MAG: 50S ribosomal protein L23 [Candidatus Falkowbacteria bacterium CG_4_10_14_0_2_um_filter_36_22]PJB20235.1 MAG: 50S ribosomal protein L23 [Candidatus Falkowbacteria bacterium CG_4_9_14_3_um_filter_36_9]